MVGSPGRVVVRRCAVGIRLTATNITTSIKACWWVATVINTLDRCMNGLRHKGSSCLHCWNVGERRKAPAIACRGPAFSSSHRGMFLNTIITIFSLNITIIILIRKSTSRNFPGSYELTQESTLSLSIHSSCTGRSATLRRVAFLVMTRLPHQKAARRASGLRRASGPRRGGLLFDILAWLARLASLALCTILVTQTIAGRTMVTGNGALQTSKPRSQSLLSDKTFSTTSRPIGHLLTIIARFLNLSYESNLVKLPN